MAAKRIAVLASGGGTNLQALLDAQEAGYFDGEIVLVFSNVKNAFALERARTKGIPAIWLSRKNFDSDEAFDRELVSILDENRIDLVVLAGYLRILTPELLRKYRFRVINIHPALLPAFGGKGFYGLRVHQAVRASGERQTGATVHFVDEGIDSGLILLQQAIAIDPTWTAEEIQSEVLKIEHKLLPKAVRAICADKVEIIDNKVRLWE